MSEGDGVTFQILTALAGVQKQLGSLEAQTTAILAEQARANDGRREIYAKLETFALTAAQVNRIAPLVDKHETAHQRASGIGRFVSAAWMVVSGALIAAGTTIAQHYWGH